MLVQFNIHFVTHWGQSMYVQLHIGDENGEPMMQNVVMNCNENCEWTAEISLEGFDSISYKYALRDASQMFFYESEGLRSINLKSSDKNKIVVLDHWRISNGDIPFRSTAFRNCFFKRTDCYHNADYSIGNVVFQLNCPQLEPYRHFAILGNQDVLGNWDASKKIRLNDSEFPIYTVAFDAKDFKFPLEYKYVIVDTKTDEIIDWEKGKNRTLSFSDENATIYVHNENLTRTIPSWKTSGVAIPVFSLRSDSGFGVGEFLDLKKMVDWAKLTGQRVIQILPINDTTLQHTNSDSYPYNAVSVYALHPLYLNLERIGKLKSKKKKEIFEAKKRELSAKSFVDYQEVMAAKWEFFRQIYSIESASVFASDEYNTFFSANKEWLISYAVFSYLRDAYGTSEFGKWGKYSVYNKIQIEQLANPDLGHYHEIAIYYFLQFHLHKQLSEVREYATANGVAIKGDIPIGVSPTSVDVWVNPELFNLDLQAGAPPDDFSTTGQNWGFPTYNWDVMEQDDYQWWKKRFQKLAEYFDAYRIDHILGFFRIWGIPTTDVWGLSGSFLPALPYSKEELESFGLHWDENRFLRPHITKSTLQKIFGEFTDEIVGRFLIFDNRKYSLKPEYDTQRKVKAYFSTLKHDLGNKEILIRDGLYMLLSEVLFVRDTHIHDRFHPRIAMHSSATFRDLSHDKRDLLDRIYVDYFYHRHTEFWKQQALRKLPVLISATDMLVCGEDLGMVPDSVPDVMNQLEILSLEIQRMPKKPDTEFAMPVDAPYRSVCTTSTHDMNPIRAWWEEDKELTQRFYNRALGIEGAAPEKCEPQIAERIIEQHLQSDAMMVILPWQDWMALNSELSLKDPFAERINVPSNPRNFWCYRMHITLEQLLKETGFNNKLKEMIAKSGR